MQDDIAYINNITPNAHSGVSPIILRLVNDAHNSINTLSMTAPRQTMSIGKTIDAALPKKGTLNKGLKGHDDGKVR